MPNKYKQRVCRLCGKVETSNWSNHWKTKHKGVPAEDLIDGELPIGPVHKDNWFHSLTGAVALRYQGTLKLIEKVTREEVKHSQPGLSVLEDPAQTKLNEQELSSHIPQERPYLLDRALTREEVEPPRSLIDQAMTLSFTAKIKMASRLLDNVATELHD